MEGDALVKQLTGATVMAMAEDVPALEKMMPGGKPHPIDRVLHDGDEVKLGGMTLVAHLTPGHTRGCTTWTFNVTEGGRTQSVLIIGSVGVNPGMKLVGNTDAPQIEQEFERSFKWLRAQHPDIPLGSHPGMYSMTEKFAKLARGGASSYVDPAGYTAELDIVEGVFRSVLAQQKAAAQAPADQKATLEDGKQLFNGMCVECHGAGGAGGDAPSLNRARLNHAPTDAALINILTNGIPNTAMPRIRRFTDNEMQQLVAYVRSLGRIAPETVPGDSREGRRGLQKPQLRGLPHRQRRRRKPRARPVGCRLHAERRVASPVDHRSGRRVAERRAADSGPRLRRVPARSVSSRSRAARCAASGSMKTRLRSRSAIRRESSTRCAKPTSSCSRSRRARA